MYCAAVFLDEKFIMVGDNDQVRAIHNIILDKKVRFLSNTDDLLNKIHDFFAVSERGNMDGNFRQNSITSFKLT